MKRDRTLRTISALFEDDDLIAVSKPSGIASAHDGVRPNEMNMPALLRADFGEVWPVHRLDRETSGVLVFARNEESHRALSLQFEGRDVEKTYHALVAGNPMWDERTADAPLLPDADRRHRTLVDAVRGKPAITHFRVLQRLKRYALVEATPETGRTHQIRAHAAQLSHPVAVDDLYGDGQPILLSQLKRNYRSNSDDEIPLMGRLALHALRLRLTHPVTGALLDLEAPYPKDFKATLMQLGKLV
jgi:RluA family pseudouridine synthase